MIRVLREESTMADADIALVCGLKFWVGCQDRLCFNSDADETLPYELAEVSEVFSHNYFVLLFN